MSQASTEGRATCTVVTPCPLSSTHLLAGAVDVVTSLGTSKLEAQNLLDIHEKGQCHFWGVDDTLSPLNK